MPFASSYYRASATPSAEIVTTEEHSRFPWDIENRSLMREVYEIFPEYSDKALPFAFVDPSRKASEQAAALEELYDSRPFCGLKLCTTYIQSFVSDLDSIGKPLVDFARDRDLPFVIHSSYDKKDPWAKLADILDFAEHNPDLRVSVAHSARFDRASLERAAVLPNCFVDTSAFDIHCLLARMGHRAIPPAAERFAADYSDPAAVLGHLADTYPDTIVWGSDMPANYFIQKYCDRDGTILECELRSRFDGEARLLRAQSESTIERIAYRNPVRLLLGIAPAG
jgi:predicted TIM-barrel fold metal-dependent hydrolase